jgi:hypothetical protein
MLRTGGRYWIGGLAMIAVAALLGAGTASGASRHRQARVVLFTAGSKSLKRGHTAVIQASVPRGDWCGLTVGRPGGFEARSRASKARSALAQFEWKVPADSADGQRLVTVRCASSKARLAHRRRVISHSTLLSVTGHKSRHGSHQIRIRVIYPLSHALPITGKGGGSYPAYGSVIIPGSSWLDGHGVNVYSDGSDGGNGYWQCVELINRLITTLHWSPTIWGNANAFYAGASSAYFVKYGNGSGYKPVPGDIVVWGGGYEGYGHVQVVNANNGSSLTVVEQNAAPSGYNVDPISASGAIASRPDPGWSPYYVEGFLHPKADTIGQSPAPTPSPTPSPNPPTTTTTTTTTTGPGTTTPPPPPTTYTENAGPAGATTFLNPANESGVGPRIGDYSPVQVSCRTTGLPVSGDGNPWYYRIASSPWNNSYYASADPFYNEPGVTSGSLSGTPLVDASVPTC